MANNAAAITRLIIRADLLELLNKPTISIEEAGKLLGLGRAGAYGAASRGEIPTIAFGKRLKVPTAKIIEMLGLEP